ncbi:NUDIX hydrolase [Pulveribacter suum]|uniref:NUDIX hydrolase n=1 Tax=Pulveribacter suum TaxID=2116657 RepID=A0A2P1NJB0_9BURK|nr:NUDIX domain-containing protein [Pulveribacter suum]AVP57127.1 NUDIX hydrolase [Pulveribacter suum]
MSGQHAPDWARAARKRAHAGAARPRLPLLLGQSTIGSVATGLLDEIGLQPLCSKRWQLSKVKQDRGAAWQLEGGDATQALNALAQALRAAGRCGPWRDEQVAVCDAQGVRQASVERGAVRVLGIATQAVHLVGLDASGERLWLQQRSRTKATHPLAWDTLMGGLVSAADDIDTALARETWEEAGLRLAQLAGLQRGGTERGTRPSDEGGPGCGWMDERIHWFRAALPAGLQPSNQDGEVERFECLPHAQVQTRLAQGVFTPEAALVLAAFYGW